MAQMRNEEVLIVLSQVLADLVRGEFQQLQNKADSSERFQLYLAKTFNKTASLLAYSAKANGLLSSSYLKASVPNYRVSQKDPDDFVRLFRGHWVT